MNNNEKTFNGLIIKGIGGFYYVKTTEDVFECKAKGRFRKEKITPLSGDKVKITVRENQENTIDEIFERKNKLQRPPVANVDKLLLIVSTKFPSPNTLVIDKMTAIAEKNGIEPVIVVTKTDIEPADKVMEIYRKTGYRVYSFSSIEGSDDLEKIKAEFKDCLTVLTGSSGVGKSTLLNAIDETLELPTAEISTKLGRGRHTTRQAEVFDLCGGRVVDTAGFSSLDIINNDVILKEDLRKYFKEFEEYLGECKFVSCTHTKDKGCKIVEMVNAGEISESRHDSYKAMYEDAKQIKSWEV